jgi:hypothetical protein
LGLRRECMVADPFFMLVPGPLSLKPRGPLFDTFGVLIQPRIDLVSCFCLPKLPRMYFTFRPRKSRRQRFSTSKYVCFKSRLSLFIFSPFRFSPKRSVVRGVEEPFYHYCLQNYILVYCSCHRRQQFHENFECSPKHYYQVINIGR